MTAADPVAAALARLDALPAPAHPVVGGCEYCYTAAELTTLDGPRERVPDELVARVAWEVSDHWADFPVLYHWLAPRILRGLIYRPELTRDEEAVGRRFVEAGWRSWPRAEVEAIDEVLRAWWLATLAAEDPRPTVAETLEFLTAATGEPWPRMLDEADG